MKVAWVLGFLLIQVVVLGGFALLISPPNDEFRLRSPRVIETEEPTERSDAKWAEVLERLEQLETKIGELASRPADPVAGASETGADFVRSETEALELLDRIGHLERMMDAHVTEVSAFIQDRDPDLSQIGIGIRPSLQDFEDLEVGMGKADVLRMVGRPKNIMLDYWTYSHPGRGRDVVLSFSQDGLLANIQRH